MFGNKNNQPASAAVGKDFTYHCVEKCTYDGRFYREGDTLVLPENKEVPHFELVEKKTGEEEK